MCGLKILFCPANRQRGCLGLINTKNLPLLPAQITEPVFSKQTRLPDDMSTPSCADRGQSASGRSHLCLSVEDENGSKTSFLFK